MSVLERVVLGTVQIGLAYGRCRDQRTISPDEARAVLDEAWSIGVRAYDTAESYGVAAERLAGWLRKNDRIHEVVVSTKVALSTLGNEPYCFDAYSRFQGVKSLTLYTHGSTNSDQFAAHLTFCRKHGLEAGQSVYSEVEVANAASVGADRIQAPVHIFDFRNCVTAQKTGVPLDARSVFLQGILLEEPLEAEARVPGIGKVVSAVHAAAHSVSHNPAAMLISSVLLKLFACDRLVVGFDHPSQISCLLEASEITPNEVQEFQQALAHADLESYSKLMDPRTW